MKRIEHIQRPVIAGLWPLASLRNAEFMNNEVPGCHVPDFIMDRLRSIESKDAARAEGIAIARETLALMQDRIDGVQISVPFGRIETVNEILEGITLR
jgi:homocysteine S-methyltransferase